VIIREVQARSIMNKSKIHDYTVNPYTGCQHGCAYCYARFMKRYSGHDEPWGRFVDVKVNAPDLLRKEITKKPRGGVWVSGVCDPYQPLERRYRVTRACLEVLIGAGWPVTVQTRSPLVTRDIDLFQRAENIEVGLSVTTADDRVRKLFEPDAPPIPARLGALRTLREAGVPTFAMIAPLLPGAEGLAAELAGKVDRVLADRINYRYADRIYKQHRLDYAMTDEYYRRVTGELAERFREAGTTFQAV